MVTFTGSLGTFDPPEAPTQNGRAVTTFHAGTRSGVAQIGAVSGGATAERIEVSIGAAAAERVVLRANPTAVPVSTGGTVELVATVVDGDGNPLPGAPVVFSTNNGTVSPNTVISDVNGEARSTLTTNREATVSASVGGVSPVTITVRAVNSGVTIALTNLTTPPEAGAATAFTVTPVSGGDPLRNVVVDFGDGTSVNLGAISGATSVTHVYTRTGQYRVTATATDINGFTSSSSTIINVNDRSPLTVTLSATPNPASIGTTGGLVEFTATASGATGGLTYFWSFGDGTSTTTTGGSTNHRYVGPGTYTVSLTVRASNGQEGYAERVVRVTTP